MIRPNDNISCIRIENIGSFVITKDFFSNQKIRKNFANEYYNFFQNNMRITIVRRC